MTTLLDVTILGEPVGQGRPRVVNMPFGARLHPAKKSAEWQSLAAQQIAALWSKPSHNEAVRLTIEAVNPRPQSIPKRLGSGRLWRTAKPDLDNVIKSVADCLVQAGVLRDDTLVVEIAARNFVAADGETACVRIVVEEAAPLLLVPWPEKVRAKKASPLPTALDL